MINSRTDCHALSKEVVNDCDLIHHSRLAEVEQVIYYLKKRKLQTSGKSKKSVLENQIIPNLIQSKVEVQFQYLLKTFQ